MVNYVIADNLEKANRAAQVRGLDVISFLPNKKESADRLRGMPFGHILVTNVKVNRKLAEQILVIDRGSVTFDWVAL